VNLDTGGRISRLALGTVQFGTEYGVANVGGRPSLEAVGSILRYARSAGVTMLDTAVAYGDSEATLGRAGVNDFDVVTKLPAVPEGCADIAGWVTQQLAGSLHRLHLPRVHAVLLHRPDQLLSPMGETLYSALQMLKAEGVAGKIGASIYAPAELSHMLGHYDLDIVQCPFNPVDRRLVTSGWLAEMKRKRIEVHARSMFLQGVLLMTKKDRSLRFSRWDALWERWHGWLGDNGVTALQACLAFGLSHVQIDKVVLGVDNLDQLHAILDSSGSDFALPPPDLASEDPDLINPSRWAPK
jgi:aryl-alcohol dehydrogenase-like predicted oxidoreductase